MNKNKSISAARVEREKEYRRDSILEAAKKIFFKEGYAKATMDSIAKCAEITKPTVYQYFKSKDELFFSLMLPILDAVKGRLDDIKTEVSIQKISSVEELFDKIYGHLYDIYCADPSSFEIIIIFQQQLRLVKSLSEERRLIIISKVKLFYTEFRELISVSIKNRLIKRVDVYHLTDLLWINFSGIIQMKAYKPNADLHIKEMLEFSKQAIVHYLKI